jgi:hypothetical protein
MKGIDTYKAANLVIALLFWRLYGYSNDPVHAVFTALFSVLFLIGMYRYVQGWFK